jgi:hypothetical protein
MFTMRPNWLKAGILSVAKALGVLPFPGAVLVAGLIGCFLEFALVPGIAPDARPDVADSDSMGGAVIGSVPVLLYGAGRASSRQASGLTFQSGGRRLGRRYSVTVARPDHQNPAVWR